MATCCFFATYALVKSLVELSRWTLRSDFNSGEWMTETDSFWLKRLTLQRQTKRLKQSWWIFDTLCGKFLSIIFVVWTSLLSIQAKVIYDPSFLGFVERKNIYLQQLMPAWPLEVSKWPISDLNLLNDGLADWNPESEADRVCRGCHIFCQRFADLSEFDVRQLILFLNNQLMRGRNVSRIDHNELSSRYQQDINFSIW